jgi:peptidoglycan hydrolase CwlO-like protein
MKVKTANEVCSIKEKIATLETENYRLGRLDELRAKSEMKCEKLEADKVRLDEKRMLLQVQLKEQTAKMESIQNVLSESEMHAKLEHLNQSLLSIQQTVTTLQEEVEMKEQQANYHPVLENIRFMVAQLNTDIKACNLH